MASADTTPRPHAALRFLASLASDVHPSWWPVPTGLAGQPGVATITAGAGAAGSGTRAVQAEHAAPSPRRQAWVGEALAREHGLLGRWPSLAQPARLMWLVPGALLRRLALDIGASACRDRIRHAVTPAARRRWAGLGDASRRFVYGAQAQRLSALLAAAVRRPLLELAEVDADARATRDTHDTHGDHTCTALGASLLLTSLHRAGPAIDDDPLARRSRLLFARDARLRDMGDVDPHAMAALAIDHLVEIDPSCRRWLSS